MRNSHRNVLFSTLTVASLALTGCSAGSPDASKDSADPAAMSSPAAAAATPLAQAPQLAVVDAADGAGAPSAVAHPTASGSKASGAPAQKSGLKVDSFDKRTGRAVISGPPKGSKPSPAKVSAGDVIASAPAPGAPSGVLAKVTEVVGTTDHGTEVHTEPATLNALLGASKAEGKVAVDPAAVEVEPLLSGVKVSWAKRGDIHFGPEGAKLPMGNLRVDVGTSIATAEGAPASAGASVHGFVQLAPEVNFSYDGRGTDGRAPGTASLGLSGDWSAQWELKGRAAASTEAAPLRIPFAKLHADPVINVGPVPVVVNLDLTCYLQVDGDGKISVDVEQGVKGDFTVGGSYSRAKGWTPVSESDIKGTPVKATATAEGQVKAALGAEASVGLYGQVGVTGSVAPYLRAQGSVQASTGAGKPSVDGKWAAFGGVDVNGALQLHLSIFGTPLFERSLPLPGIHKEWRLAGSR